MKEPNKLDSGKSDSRPHSRLKILFADDELSLQELMSIELPRMGAPSDGLPRRTNGRRLALNETLTTASLSTSTCPA